MAVRSILFGAAILATASLVSGCSKTGEPKDTAAAPTTQPAQPVATPLASGALIENGQSIPVDAAARGQSEREAQLEFKASAAEARARLAEIELHEQTARALAQQQQATQMEAARAAALAVENAGLRADAENIALRARMLEREQRAVDAERAAYGVAGSVIVVQPPQRHGYGRGPWNSPQIGGVSQNVGLNRPAVPDLTPPGPPATFSPPRTLQPPQLGEPQFDTMRARKGGLREASTP
jgi:hypothetical protein